MTKTRVAVVGVGFMGRLHLEALRHVGTAEVVAIVDPHLDKARELAAQFAVERVEADYQCVLEDPGVDAVHICTSHALHFAMDRDTLEAGKHVL